MDSERKEVLSVIGGELEQKKSSLESVRSVLEVSHPELVRLTEEIATLEAKKQTMLDEFAKNKQETMNSIQEDIDAKKSEYMSVKGTPRANILVLDAIKGEIDELESKKQAALADGAAAHVAAYIQTKIDMKKSEYMKINDTPGANIPLLDAIEREIGELESKKSATAASNVEGDALSSIQREIDMKKAKLDSVMATLEADPTLTKLEGEVSALEGRKQLHEETIARSEEKIASLETKKQTILDEFERAKAEINISVQREISSIQTTIGNIRDALEAKTRLPGEIADLESRKREILDILGDKDNRVNSIQAEIDAKKLEYVNVRFAPVVDATELARLEKEINDLGSKKQKIENLTEDDVKSLQDEIDKKAKFLSKVESVSAEDSAEMVRNLEDKITKLEQERQVKIAKLTKQKNDDLNAAQEELIWSKSMLDDTKFRMYPKQRDSIRVKIKKIFEKDVPDESFSMRLKKIASRIKNAFASDARETVSDVKSVTTGATGKVRIAIKRKIKKLIPKESFGKMCKKAVLKLRDKLVYKVKDAVLPKSVDRSTIMKKTETKPSPSAKEQQLWEAIEYAEDVFKTNGRTR